jgi:hypothetical protein
MVNDNNLATHTDTRGCRVKRPFWWRVLGWWSTVVPACSTTVLSAAVTTCNLITYTVALTPTLVTTQATTPYNRQTDRQTNKQTKWRNPIEAGFYGTWRRNRTQRESKWDTNFKGGMWTRAACSTGCKRLAVKIYVTSWRSGKILHDSVQPNYYMTLCHLIKLVHDRVSSN